MESKLLIALVLGAVLVLATAAILPTMPLAHAQQRLPGVLAPFPFPPGFHQNGPPGNRGGGVGAVPLGGPTTIILSDGSCRLIDARLRCDGLIRDTSDTSDVILLRNTIVRGDFFCYPDTVGTSSHSYSNLCTFTELHHRFINGQVINGDIIFDANCDPFNAPPFPREVTCDLKLNPFQ